MAEALTSEIAKAALSAQRLARANQRRRNLVFLAGALLGTGLFTAAAVTTSGAAGLGTFTISIAIGVAAAVFCLVFCSKRVFTELAKCPRCEFSWEIKEGRTVPYEQQMQNWLKCPGCELPMSEKVLQQAARQHRNA